MHARSNACRRGPLAALAGCTLIACALAAAGSQAKSSDPKREVPAKKHARHRDEGPAPVAQAHDASRGMPTEPRTRLCIIDRELVNQQADANVASNRRLAELRSAAQSTLDVAKQKLDLQLKGIDDELRSRPAEAPALQKQRRAYEEQSKGLAAQAGLYTREIEATRQTVTQQLTAATTPLMQVIAKEQSCGLVLAREAVIDTGDAVDISNALIEAMNRRIHVQPFPLVNLAER